MTDGFHKMEKRARARIFHLVRDEDVSGVSGTGIVAEGIEFSDGTVALRWLSANPTSVVFHDNGLESVEAIHGHSGATRIVMQNDRIDEREQAAQRIETLMLEPKDHCIEEYNAGLTNAAAAVRGESDG